LLSYPGINKPVFRRDGEEAPHRLSNFRRDLVSLLPRVRRFALALAGTRADAEDLVQSAVERALRAEGRWRDGGRLDSWMFKIVQNLWIDQRRANRTPKADLSEAMDLPGEDGREVVSRRAEVRAVRHAFDGLTPEQQAVVALVIVDGASYKEASEALGAPIGTIMSRLARARAAMVAQMSSDETSGEVSA
jgi:RNA polymerase sigma-70 factor, ECF subfamily